MKNADQSLRRLVDKWLGSVAQRPARVTGFGYCRQNGWRYVRIETQRLSGELAIFFFRHDDGAWRVFPPVVRRPSMRVA
ncbi:MAG TPA: hypothetical protein VN289_21730 [Paraburkholderia sp.]|nr:hypothetical protein [Paraburkholderia sp.]